MKKLGKIKDLLSREEMKQIQGGSGSGLCYGNSDTCRTTGTKKCCTGSCQATTGTFGICWP